MGHRFRGSTDKIIARIRLSGGKWTIPHWLLYGNAVSRIRDVGLQIQAQPNNLRRKSLGFAPAVARVFRNYVAEPQLMNGSAASARPSPRVRNDLGLGTWPRNARGLLAL